MTSSLDWIKDHETEPLPAWVSAVPTAFENAWKNNNPELIERLMGLDENFLTQDNLDKALTSALKKDPLPVEALNKFVVMDKDAGKRLIRLAQNNTFYHSLDFNEVFHWMAKENAIQTADKEQFVHGVVEQAYVKIQEASVNSWGADSAMNFLKFALDHPYSREAVSNRHPRDSWVLLSVAINKRSIHLLEQIDGLEEALRDVLSQRNRTSMVWPTRGTVELARRSWRQWERMLEQSPALDRAWKNVQVKDAGAVDQAQRWIRAWIPDGKFDGSPMEKWIESPDDFEQHPLCPGMFGKLSFELLTMDSKTMKRHFQFIFGVSAGEGRAAKKLLDLRDRLVAEHKGNPDKNGAANGWINEMCAVQPHLLSISGTAGHNLIHRAATGTQAGKAELGKVLLDPRTADELFSKEHCREIMTWLGADKRWNLWRDNKGNTLTHAWAQRQDRKNISWTMLRKLSRLFPEQLTSPNKDGLCLLDRTDFIDEKRRVQLLRRVLGKKVDHSQVRTITTPKM